MIYQVVIVEIVDIAVPARRLISQWRKLIVLF
jgi:hypothetical protein